MVDDSVQTASVPVAVGIVTTIAPDSTCYDLGGTCWADSVAGGEAGLPSVAPARVIRGTFKLDFADQNDRLHHFTLYNATFVLKKVVKTTQNYVDPIYAVSQDAIPSQEFYPRGETPLWANVVPIRSTLVQIGTDSYSGGFTQNGKASGTFWRRT